MAAAEIRKVLELRDSPSNPYDRDFANICVETLKTLPFEVAAGEFFITVDDEKQYLTTINLIMDLASDYEENSGLIATICSVFDGMNVKSADGTVYPLSVAICRMFQTQPMNGLFSVFNSVHVIEAQRVTAQAITAILAAPNEDNRKRLINLFDRYIISLATVGPEQVLKCHQPLTKLGRRKPVLTNYVVQSIASPEFQMKDFLEHSPIAMFFGYIEPIRDELHVVMADFASLSTGVMYYPNNWFRRSYAWHSHHQGRLEQANIVARIHNFPRGFGSRGKIVKKMYPKENLCSIHLFIRPI